MSARLLLPHGAALAAFAGAFGVIAATGSNRTDPDLWLGLAGHAAGALALAASALALWRVVRGRLGWPWALAHLAALAGVAAAGLGWIAAHLA